MGQCIVQGETQVSNGGRIERTGHYFWGDGVGEVWAVIGWSAQRVTSASQLVAPLDRLTSPRAPFLSPVPPLSLPSIVPSLQLRVTYELSLIDFRELALELHRKHAWRS